MAVFRVERNRGYSVILDAAVQHTGVCRTWGNGGIAAIEQRALAQDIESPAVAGGKGAIPFSASVPGEVSQ